MALVQFLCRYQKDPSDDVFKNIDKDLDTEAIIQGDRFDRDKEKTKLLKDAPIFEYGPMMINLKDVCLANQVDPKHTCVRLYNGANYTFKVPYILYVALYQALLGVLVTDYTQLDESEKLENG